MVSDWMTPKMTHWPPDWLPVIDEARGETPFAEFVRECVRDKIGRRKLKPPPKRGRPKRKEKIEK